MTKETAKAKLSSAATALGLKEADAWKNQRAHLLAVVRVVLDAAEVDDADARKAAFSAVKEVGHGFGCNSSQFNQWVEKAEKSGGEAVDTSDLEV